MYIYLRKSYFINSSECQVHAFTGLPHYKATVLSTYIQDGLRVSESLRTFVESTTVWTDRR